MTELKCPKCLTNLRSVERNGVVIDHCGECGGIFLDRGELERLIEQENAFIDREARSRGRDDRGRRDYFDDDDDDDDRREYHDERGHPRRKKKRRNFLEDLLDFG